jgi:hypothetical protein
MSEENKTEKRGIKTSEFWLAAITSGISLAILAGWIEIDGATTADKVSTMVVMALSSLGYTVGRSWTKSKAPASE